MRTFRRSSIAVSATLLFALAGLLFLSRPSGRTASLPADRAGGEAAPVMQTSAAPAPKPSDVPMPAQHRPAAGGFYWAPPGSEFAFDMTVRMTSRLGPAGAPEIANVLEGRMEVVVQSRDKEAILVALRFPSLKVTPAGTVKPDDPHWAEDAARALDATTVLRMADDGRTLAYGFSAMMTAESRNLIRTIVSGFRFVVPAESGVRWSVEEADASGSYRAEYEAAKPIGNDGRLTVNRRRPAPAEAGASPAATCSTRAVGGATGILDAKQGWLVRADVDESLEMDLPGFDATASLHFCGTLVLRSAGRVAGEAFAAQAQTGVAGPWSPADGSGERVERGGEVLAESWRKRLEGVSCESLITEIEALIRAGRFDSRELYEALEKLSWLARLDDQVVERVLAAGLDARMPDDVASALFTALGTAGTPAAKAALCRVLGDDAVAEARRVAAAQSMFHLDGTDSDVPASVLALLGRADLPRALEGTALLLLGALAGQTGSSVGLLNHLLLLENHAAASGLTDVWLEALGNARPADLLPQIAKYLTSPDESLRAAAISALRHATSPGALEILDFLARNDASVAIRGTAIETAARNLTPSTLALVSAVLQSDPDLDVRLRAVLALTPHVGSNQNGHLVRPILQWAAANDPSSEVRMVASQLLS